MARAVKAAGFPMVLCFVVHRENIDRVDDILALAENLEADYVELATTQYYGSALVNRTRLLPSKAQRQAADAAVNSYRVERGEKMKIYHVVPDYYEMRPKACMNGWGSVFLTVTPDGTALRCRTARQIPGIEFTNVRDHSVEWIWQASDAMNRFRGDNWMREPCRTCRERDKDFGGCRCQAFMLTGDAANADPVCSKTPHHHVVREAAETGAATTVLPELVFRNPENSRRLASPSPDQAYQAALWVIPPHRQREKYDKTREHHAE